LNGESYLRLLVFSDEKSDKFDKYLHDLSRYAGSLGQLIINNSKLERYLIKLLYTPDDEINNQYHFRNFKFDYISGKLFVSKSYDWSVGLKSDKAIN
jgi:hypothetical protein